ncbi:putative transcriptional regulatory protein [Virgibacillus pantothenticus]|uniref:Probable transcriptional regulatory protein AFK71_19865 n=1 Tax=Virgibacillus pantothenticus TaxID=1473 RepID=A0A0L0QPY8_VIRPA|nr:MULTISPECIES: YebC/PmpR family DNA-binding transcriptional regulator [Virgibacillus]API90657.1 transcriptional regulator [Virgibacillus sp. 6R]KNE20611.1 transcriptional regulator [Virgibacillus pantothenticus]MBS7429778.1 YebC/PmpR family DNA-binding transcriptional regulator [Virgibacillus sp. 19R1-5]MBU8565653.1 YebC/PmpR family DNA-binding transcriptional regulator [Virgibacillus pantothenticus]MBU8601265.1 YebC/PmpR family DNA-binding transcriptional regulator [Virgibacillus pantothent
MAGHSKWKNIQRRKNAQDAKKGKIFMRHAKDIYTAAKQGGGDITTNPSLRLAVDKAKADNMPNDNIDRAIKKATGTLDGASFEELTYEGYGPGGVAVIVHVLTDNKNRTAADIRHAFKKNNGNLGENGSVSFMFDRKGYIVITNEQGEIDEDELTLEALEAGAEDIEVDDGMFEIFTAPEDLQAVVDQLNKAGYSIADSEVTLIPQTTTSLSEEDVSHMMNLIETLEENEDVQDIHHNLEVTE